MDNTITRKFLGKTEGFTSKQEQELERRHLKAYLKGNTHFFAKVLADVIDPENPTGPTVKRWVKSHLEVKQEIIKL